MKVSINTLTPELFLTLYSSVGWEPPCIEQVRTALEHTVATFTCYNNNTPVGMVRLLGDGGMSFYVKDFAVIPSYQGKGVPFYAKKGFEERPCEWDGPGMLKMVR